MMLYFFHYLLGSVALMVCLLLSEPFWAVVFHMMDPQACVKGNLYRGLKIQNIHYHGYGADTIEISILSCSKKGINLNVFATQLNTPWTSVFHHASMQCYIKGLQWTSWSCEGWARGHDDQIIWKGNIQKWSVYWNIHKFRGSLEGQAKDHKTYHIRSSYDHCQKKYHVLLIWNRNFNPKHHTDEWSIKNPTLVQTPWGSWNIQSMRYDPLHHQWSVKASTWPLIQFPSSHEHPIQLSAIWSANGKKWDWNASFILKDLSTQIAHFSIPIQMHGQWSLKGLGMKCDIQGHIFYGNSIIQTVGRYHQDKGLIIDLKGQRILIQDQDHLMHFLCDAKARITIDPSQHVEITGHSHVYNSFLRIENKPWIRLSSDVVKVKEKNEIWPYRMNWAVHFNSNNRFFYDQILELEDITGTLLLHADHRMHYEANGRLRIGKGRYWVTPKVNVPLTEGEVDYVRDALAQPRLHMRFAQIVKLIRDPSMTRNFDQCNRKMTIGFLVTGHAGHPSIVLFSHPDTLSDEAIVLGLSLGYVTHDVSSQTMGLVFKTASAFLLGRHQVKTISNPLERLFNTSDIHIVSEENPAWQDDYMHQFDRKTGKSLMIGKEITRRLHFYYTMGLDSSSSQNLMARYLFNPQWFIQADYTDQYRCVGIFYDYMADT